MKKILSLLAILFFLGCAPRDQKSDESTNSNGNTNVKTASVAMSIDFGQYYTTALSKRVIDTRKPLGTYTDVTSVTIDVKREDTFLVQGQPLSNNSGTWEVTIPKLLVGPQFTFIARANNSSNTLIFTGTTFQTLNSENGLVRIQMVGPIDDGTGYTLPKITGIQRPTYYR